MDIFPTQLSEVKLLQPKLFADDRGWFAEVFNRKTFAAIGLPSQFAQDNHSFSRRGVLRGLHYQLGKPQGKLVRVLSGEIWDVAVDIRRGSPEFGKWAGFRLQPRTPEGHMQFLWIPEGYAHGFLVLSETAEVLYKATDLYYPEGERTVIWNDPDLAIAWPLNELPEPTPSLSPKDARGSTLREADLPG